MQCSNKCDIAYGFKVQNRVETPCRHITVRYILLHNIGNINNIITIKKTLNMVILTAASGFWRRQVVVVG